jgi:outer membrane receptor protein involved in Fe transport
MSISYGARPKCQGETADAKQWNVTDVFTLAGGVHAIKFGIDYRRLSTFLNVNQLTEGAFFFSEQDVFAGSPGFSHFGSQFGPKPPEPVYANFSAYAQDDWKVSQRLTLSLGLRWDVNPPPGNGNGNSPYTLNQIADLNTAQLAPTGTPLWHTDYLGFAPRAGLAYVLKGATGHETVLRGGFGIFYDTGNTTASQGFLGVGFGSFANYSGVPFPLTPAQLVLPLPSTDSPYHGTVYASIPTCGCPTRCSGIFR